MDINTVVAEAVDRSQLPAESKNIQLVVGGRARRHGLRRPGPAGHRAAQPDRQRHPLLAGEHQGGHRRPDQGRPGRRLRDGPGRGPQPRGPGTRLRTLLPRGRCPFPAHRRHRPWPEHRQTCYFQPRRRGDPLVPARAGFHLHHPASRRWRARTTPTPAEARKPAGQGRQPRPPDHTERDAAGVHEQGASA